MSDLNPMKDAQIRCLVQEHNIRDGGVRETQALSRRHIIIDAVFSEISKITGTGVYLMILECLQAPRRFHGVALRSAALQPDFIGLGHK